MYTVLNSVDQPSIMGLRNSMELSALHLGTTGVVRRSSGVCEFNSDGLKHELKHPNNLYVF